MKLISLFIIPIYLILLIGFKFLSDMLFISKTSCKDIKNDIMTDYDWCFGNLDSDIKQLKYIRDFNKQYSLSFLSQLDRLNYRYFDNNTDFDYDITAFDKYVILNDSLNTKTRHKYINWSLKERKMVYLKNTENRRIEIFKKMSVAEFIKGIIYKKEIITKGKALFNASENFIGVIDNRTLSLSSLKQKFSHYNLTVYSQARIDINPILYANYKIDNFSKLGVNGLLKRGESLPPELLYYSLKNIYSNVMNDITGKYNFKDDLFIKLTESISTLENKSNTINKEMVIAIIANIKLYIDEFINIQKETCDHGISEIVIKEKIEILRRYCKNIIKKYAKIY